MNHRALKLVPATAALLALAVLASAPAQACACCSNDGHRNVQTQDLDAYAASILAEVRFDAASHLYTGEGESEGSWMPSGTPDFHLAVTKAGKLWSFEFAQRENGPRGTLTFSLPGKVSRFEIDPRETSGTPNGPVLYKEWRLTAPGVGSGMFDKVTGGEQRTTLILHGRGNGCTNASQFTAWTIVLHGPKLTTSFFGTLAGEPTAQSPK